MYTEHRILLDEEVVTFLTSFINEKIKNMIEIAGNNGVFAEKIRKLEKRDFEVTI